ncbi:G patch domain-containing protein 3 [Acanthosepion pharaonis]|uniref:G patch domain-containing protein 3 n=1 Tax=Acanthosepion pharaonis TaxID=158019 RepID=A0A812DWU7_ACAPH|nr:G patch domain-containing protein 3 [Sepia pharaonis]
MAATLLYAVVGNIPSRYHSSDLRNFFSRIIETDGFDCFHFRHRPEARETERNPEISLNCTQNNTQDWQETHGILKTKKKDPKLSDTCCCVIRLSESQYKNLMQMYNCRHWITEKGECMRNVCHIKKIKLNSKSQGDNIEPLYKTRLEQSQMSSNREEFYEEDLKNLAELHPPTVMPKDDADECEEWERHEALHDDPSNQERNEERLFEQEIELKWEKGGSGLVFYTDAQFWKQQEGDFDEQTADDWDVDMSGYYEPGSGDMDGRDLIRIRRDQRRRDGIEDEDNRIAGIGKFEKHTKGFGRKIMERHGWKDGEGLGSSASGISEALTNDGQNPRCKTGFGFQEPKRGRRTGIFHKKRQELQEWHGPIISTVYDDPSVTDPGDPLLRRNEPYQLKRRKIDIS